MMVSHLFFLYGYYVNIYMTVIGVDYTNVELTHSYVSTIVAFL